MKAVVYRGMSDLRVEEVAEPHIESPTDAVIKVTTGSICTSDIHIMEMGLQEAGQILGHEYCGVVVEVGNEVRYLKEGDRVVGDCGFRCGHCFYCQHRQYTLCENMGIFGFHGVPGVHAEYTRIPYADNTLHRIPDDLPDEKAIFTTDVLATGLTGVLRANVGLGETVAIFGAGRIGLGAVACAQLFGPSLVIAVDVMDYRLDVAQKLGAVPINASKEDTVARIKELTDGRGADVGIEAAGFEPTFRACLQSTRRGGRVSVLGMFTQPVLFDITERFEDIFTLNIGLANPTHTEELIRLVNKGKLDLRLLITHTFPLSEALKAYELFEKKAENCIQVILKP